MLLLLFIYYFQGLLCLYNEVDELYVNYRFMRLFNIIMTSAIDSCIEWLRKYLAMFNYTH